MPHRIRPQIAWDLESKLNRDVTGGAIKFAKKMGYKVQEVELPSIKLPRGRLRYLSVEEEQRLMQVLEPTASLKWSSEFTVPEVKREMQDLYDIVVMLIDTGARHTEISTLRWDSINLEDGSPGFDS